MKLRDLHCTGCHVTTPHRFVANMGGFERYACSKCGRDKLVTVATVTG